MPDTRAAKNTNIKNIAVQSPTMNASSLGAFSQSAFDTKFKKLSDLFVNKLKDLEDRLMDRIGLIAADISNIRTELGSAFVKINEVEKRISDVSGEIKDFRSRLNHLENVAVSTDVVVHGVPDDTDVKKVIESALSTLNCGSLSISSVFRVRAHNNKNNNKCSPVILKLNTAQDRVRLFRSLAAYRKTKKRQFRHSDAGLPGDKNISFYECLTSENRKILLSALRLKGNNQLHAVFSLHGNVFVRVKPNDEAKKITSLADVMAMIDIY